MKLTNGVPLKVKGFVWKARIDDRILTKVALRSHGVHVGSEEFSFCFGSQESSEHLLLKFSFTAAVCDTIYC